MSDCVHYRRGSCRVDRKPCIEDCPLHKTEKERMQMERGIYGLTCYDCRHCKLAGWWDMMCVCELMDFPVDSGSDVCRCFERKKQK